MSAAAPAGNAGVAGVSEEVTHAAALATAAPASDAATNVADAILGES